MAVSAKPRKKGPAVPYDFFPTPPWCVDRLLDRHALDLGFGRRVNAPSLLEPTVGDGAIVRAVDAWIARSLHIEMEHSWTGVELRIGALLPGTELDCHVEGYDFRTWSRPDSVLPFDLAMGNLPFALAEPMLRRCFEVSRATAILLRVDFLGSAERAPFWAGVGASPHLRILPDRPSFDGAGTDSSTYAWFVWGAELRGPRVDVLDTTPASVRAAQKPALPTGLPQLGLDL